MPLNAALGAVTAGPSSRKRTHAQITRSETRSSSPPPTKRRRTGFAPTSQSSSHNTPSTTPTPPRFTGDGLDFRRPIISNMDVSQEGDFIDLTLDEDSPPPPSTFTSLAPIETRTRSRDRLQNRQQRPTSAAPPFDRWLDAIDLTSEEDEVQETRRSDRNTSNPNPQASPEVLFVRERQLPAPVLPNNVPVEVRRRLPTPPIGGRRFGMGPLADIFRNATQAVIGGTSAARNAYFDALHPLRQNANNDPARPGADMTGYEDVTLDYGRPAFALGADMLFVDDSDPVEEPNIDYKPPPAAREGYTRSYSDDDVLVCVACGDELATGDNEVKQQVWISKRCGHVYCGTCATSGRSIGASFNGRNQKRVKPPPKKPPVFKNCKADGCNKSLTGKAGLFQIYL